jgi:AcrR family transcriptional regulator
MHIPAEPAERSRPGMSTGRITAAALQIVDTEGSQALTMRRLGQALDRKVMTLYRYVPSKDALLDGVVARVLTDLAINPAAADWRQELRDLHALHAYRLFFGFLHGHIVDELQEIIDNPDEANDLLRLGLHRLPRREFPRTRQLRRSCPSPARRRTDDHRPAIPLPASTHQPYHLKQRSN